MTVIAWLFPGQGSQLVGMGKSFAENCVESRSIFEQADQCLGFSLSKLCFEGPISDLTRTENTQPAILTTSIAILRAVEQRISDPFQPSFGAGHSLGEFSALVAAGVMTLENAVELTRIRGQAMQAAVAVGEGFMAAAIGIEKEKLLQICIKAAEGEVVQPANFNAPGQTVLAGHIGAVTRAMRLIEESGGKAIPLQVSAPFHCALMSSATLRLKNALKSVKMNPFRFPVVSNVEGLPNQDSSRVTDLLVRQVESPVQWANSMVFLAENGVTHALEIGPGKVLAGLLKRCTKQIKILSVNEYSDLDKLEDFLRS